MFRIKSEHLLSESFINEPTLSTYAMASDAQDTVEYTKYEKARLIGARALQIAMGAPFLLKLEESDLEGIGYNPIEIAKKEFTKGLIPLTVRRKETENNAEEK